MASLHPIYIAKLWIVNRARPGHVRDMKSIVDLEPNDCRWPVGKEDDDHLFCGGRARSGKPYCAAHYALAYRRITKSRPRARRFDAHPVLAEVKTVELSRVLFRHDVC